ncbi:hypothetical protein [Flagellimonas halotolerans]|uniref:Pectate lyase n=1 Tax=Flagellimonas halotolerans TaxID=3112164 RepID=A0ABU6ISJ5_9FLAO|nr:MULTISPECIES: hypothetical protein [unclassified Allomuricauda]MEC3966164.1 hypothetical protein [Muricauda sp. SYSU M86414]MEC4266029.1 hypothetical protein [Muricauda sp. SYSU M84420]
MTILKIKNFGYKLLGLAFMMSIIISCGKDQDIFNEILSENPTENADGNGADTGTDQDSSNGGGEDQNDSGEAVKDNVVSDELKAFPTAEGAGAYSQGGRGGQVIHVTTLEWNAPGGLKEALETTTPRIIVFDVSGTIKVPDSFYTVSGRQYSGLTIAGQTAPPGGITIETYGKFGILNMEDVIIRYVRFVDKSRFNANGSGNYQALDASGNTRLIIDHCSFRYAWNTASMIATDNTSISGQDDYTLQRNIFGESATGVLLGSSVQRPTRAGDNSFHHNAFYGISHRFPNTGGNGNFEVFNNVIFNWANRLSSIYNDGRVNHQNNYFKPGPRTDKFLGNFTGGYNQFMHQIGGGYTGMLYTNGNVYEGNDNLSQNNQSSWFEWIGIQIADVSSYMTNSAPGPLGAPINLQSAQSAYFDVLEDVGANATLDSRGEKIWFLDEVDATYISDILNDDCTYCDGPNFEYRSLANESGLTYPNIEMISRPSNYDSDQDGMPDAWETANGLNPNVNDSAQDADGDGYTNIEEFLNMVDIL